MARFPTPDREGHYWAKLRLADDPDLNSVNWEVVQVFENHTGPASEPEKWLASVPGIQKSQPIDAFVWGPLVPLPAALAKANGNG